MKDMSQSLALGKSTMDNGYGMFRTMLAYKLERQGKQLVTVDRFYPSSQLCSDCGYHNKDTKNLYIPRMDMPRLRGLA